MEASKLIDQKLATITGWRGEMMKTIRKLIREVDPGIIEEWKWMGTPVWNHNGIICCANAHTHRVKVTFMNGAKLKDPQRIFNAELAGNTRRAISLSEGDALNAAGLKDLIRAGIALNAAKPAARKAGGASSVTAKPPSSKKAPAKKAPAKKTPAKKTPAKKTPARKTPVSKPAAKTSK